ncbi:MAG: cryptochrome/photolyase family protein [Pararhodobacter sp.]|nr:cryptochrome/photolyase family protein [Pararhodobacter sp.]
MSARGGRLVLVLGDQLTEGAGALGRADQSRDTVVMAEVAEETGYVPHHPQKIVLVLSAMRQFAARLRDKGWRVAYTRLDDRDNTGTITGELIRRAEATGAHSVLATQPGEWRLRQALQDMPLRISIVPDDRFLCPPDVFANWAKGRKSLRMEHFYRLMRKRTGYLMQGDAPAGGQWNYDHDNRKPARDDLLREKPMRHAPDAIVQEVIALVQRRFGGHFGAIEPFNHATTRRGALAVLRHFIAHHLAEFGPYQDAMLARDPFLHHALIAPYLNLGLLTPAEVCDAVQQAHDDGAIPINSAEGFIRQIIGWREFVRGIYDLHGPGYADQNALGHGRRLPAFYWGEPTKMACVSAVVEQTRVHAYAHHIQRLMVTGNLALLACVDPQQVHEWYLSVYADAYEWVEAPNTIGMSQFADGGVLGSKPYVSSGAYIARMSDYCSGCAYDVKVRAGTDACPFNLLYWHFLDRHRDRFEGNARMAPMYRTWDRMDADHRARVLADAASWLKRLDAGGLV